MKEDNVTGKDLGSQRSELSSEPVVSLTSADGNFIEQELRSFLKFLGSKDYYVDVDGSVYSDAFTSTSYKTDAVREYLNQGGNVQESDTRDDAMKGQQSETNASPSTSREELAITEMALEYATLNGEGCKPEVFTDEQIGILHGFTAGYNHATQLTKAKEEEIRELRERIKELENTNNRFS